MVKIISFHRLEHDDGKKYASAPASETIACYWLAFSSVFSGQSEGAILFIAGFARIRRMLIGAYVLLHQTVYKKVKKMIILALSVKSNRTVRFALIYLLIMFIHR